MEVETSKGVFQVGETVRYTPTYSGKTYDARIQRFGINAFGMRTVEVEFMTAGGAHYFDTAMVAAIEKVQWVTCCPDWTMHHSSACPKAS